VTGDSVYGADSAVRRAVEAAGKGSVLTVTSAQHLGLRPVGDWAKEVPKGGWTRLSAGDGAKGPGLDDWACVPFRGAREGWQKALLIRRALEKPDELTFYLTLAPEGTDLATLVQVAGTRWTARAGRLKPALRPPRARLGSTRTRCAPGRDGIVPSRWPCWPMPIWPLCVSTLSGGEDLDLAADLLPLTVPEVRRLIWRLVWARPPDPGRILAWSDWRRRHQQRARRSH
jgi:hypothetical protein